MGDVYTDNLLQTPGNCLFENFFYLRAKQEASPVNPVGGHADGLSFHPSVFTPTVQEDATELTIPPPPDNDIQHEEILGPADHPTPRSCEGTRAVLGSREHHPEEINCPFYGCDFRHLVDYTKETLERRGSWKNHIRDSHWSGGSDSWRVCQWDRCKARQASRSSAWKHLAVHVKEFHVKCSYEGCFSIFTRADRVPQHIREVHLGEGRR